MTRMCYLLAVHALGVWAVGGLIGFMLSSAPVTASAMLYSAVLGVALALLPVRRKSP